MGTDARIACIGECMVEFRQASEGLFAAGFGGDTLNTAVYLARLGLSVDYVTALGDDEWSRRMEAAWAAEGVGLDAVERIAGATPGLYVIEVDERGERRFSYWREMSAARRLFDEPRTERVEAALGRYDWLYLSGISLSLYGQEGRERLFAALGTARQAGTKIAFDTNFRPRGWPDAALARAAFERAFALADILFASTEDLELLFPQGTMPQAGAGAERVIKDEDLTVTVTWPEGPTVSVAGQAAERVVDTTAAGDSFAAAYLAARIDGAEPRAAAQAGHRLAARVVGHHGALIPREAMPD